MSTAASAFVIPDFIQSGLWMAIQNLFGGLWPALVLALALLLFGAFAGLVVDLVRDASSRVRRM